MKKVKLISLELNNFKGIKHCQVDFTDETNIYGANESGKTTLNDAFTWLLSGKNSEDKQDFNIKTLDGKNNPIHRLEHEVKGVFEFDNSLNELKRIYKEKWTKKRGAETTEFDGHETLYFWNDVPLSKTDYNAKINYLMDENIVKLITNPLYFNQGLKWEERRAILTKMAGEINNDEIFDKIATPESDFMDLINALNQNKTVSEYKKEIAVKKKKLKDNLEGITPRIDEVKRGMPEKIDFKSKQKELDLLNEKLSNLDEKMINKNKAADALNENYYAEKRKLDVLKNKANDLKINAGSVNSSLISKLSLEKNTLNNDLQIRLNNINAKKNEIGVNGQTIEKYINRISELEAENTVAKQKWVSINSSVLDVSNVDTKCPACKQNLPETDTTEKVENLRINFNNDKQKQLAAINAKGQANNIEIASYNDKITSLKQNNANLETAVLDDEKQRDILNNEISLKQTQIAGIENQKETLSPEYYDLENEIKNFILIEEPKVDVSDFENEKNDLKNEIIEVQKSLNTKTQIDQSKLRISELESQETTMAQELANLEKAEFSIDKFVSAKIEMITARTNEMFKYVTFKMYDEQINGGVKETCDALLNGVPFSDLNTASKINAGIDIINALIKYFNVSAPIFIDNRESITNIIKCESQIINLIVSPADLKLRVENK